MDALQNSVCIVDQKLSVGNKDKFLLYNNYGGTINDWIDW